MFQIPMEFCDPALPGREDIKVLASRRAFQAGTRHRRKVASSPPICFIVYNSVHIVVLYAVFQYIHVYIYIPGSFRLLKFQMMICYDICVLLFTYFILSYLLILLKLELSAEVMWLPKSLQLTIPLSSSCSVPKAFP